MSGAFHIRRGGLLEQILHLLKERLFLRGFLVVPEFREFLVEFLLFAAKVLRDFHADVHVQASTVAALVQWVQALFAQAQDAPGLSAGCPVKGGACVPRAG